ncbi:hypothetical protein FPV67DRAFT_618878 [Lyophyllum atratum]|nr:hypothetical protein FPV67DRAFT_618878 [Lyophyllum atratum]
MESLQNRIDSFSKVKRVKNPSKPSSSVAIKWPHTAASKFIATPETLAEAGFYFNPSFDDRDNVTCFMCEKQLSDWEVDDDPFDIHWDKCGDNCCWAIVRCGLRVDLDQDGGFIFPDKSRLPASKLMERARLETFSAGDGWLHDQVKNHSANSRKMARGGFVFTPQHVGDDLATCLYCHVALSGWDADDDPTEEHRKRATKSGQSCPFFALSDAPSKPPSRSTSQSKPNPASKSQLPKHPRSTSTSANRDIVLPMKTHDGDGDETDAPPASSSRRSTTRERSTSGTTKGAKASRKSTRSQSRSGLKNVAEDEEGAGDEEEEQEDMTAPPPRTGKAKAKKSLAAKPKARSRSKSVARTAAELSDDEPEEEVAKTTSRSRAKAKATEPMDEEEEVTVLKKSTRGKARSRLEEPEEEEVEEVKVLKKLTRGRAPSRTAVPKEEEVQDVKALKKSTRGKAQPRAEEDDQDEERVVKVLKSSTRGKPPSRVEDPEDAIPRKPSRTKKIKTPVEPEPAPRPEPEPEPEVEEEEEEKKPRQPSRSKVPRKPSRSNAKAAPAPEESVEDEDNQPEDVAPPPVVEKKKRVPSSSKPSSAATKAKTAPPPAKAKERPKAPSPQAQETEREAEDIPQDDEAPADEEDEMDAFVSRPVSPPPVPIPKKQQKEKEPRMEEDDIQMAPLFVPKRGANKIQPAAKALDVDVDMEEVHAKYEVTKKPGKERKPSSAQAIEKEKKSATKEREKEEVVASGKGRKASGLKVVEISTDEEGDQEDDGGKATRPKAKEPKQAQDTARSVGKEMPEKTRPQVLIEITPPSKPAKVDVAVPRQPSPLPSVVDASGDVEMSSAEHEASAQEAEAEPVMPHEDSAPRTPPRHGTPTLILNGHAEPAPAAVKLPIPALSKLPFTPLQNLTDAELDMTVEEWIRYQMEVEYDKFRRDGERELGRFKKRAEEVRGAIEQL